MSKMELGLIVSFVGLVWFAMLGFLTTLRSSAKGRFWGYILSFVPRSCLQVALYEQWVRSLSRGDRARLLYWGATGNSSHHHFAWADHLPAKNPPTKEIET